MRTFDITQDGKQIIFDRLRENSVVVLIDRGLTSRFPAQGAVRNYLIPALPQLY